MIDHILNARTAMVQCVQLLERAHKRSEDEELTQDQLVEAAFAYAAIAMMSTNRAVEEEVGGR